MPFSCSIAVETVQLAQGGIYDSLRLWVDANHDGTTQRRELESLEAAGGLALSLEYRKIDRRDRRTATDDHVCVLAEVDSAPATWAPASPDHRGRPYSRCRPGGARSS